MGTGADAPSSRSVDVLGWDFAFELNEVARQTAERAGIDVRFWRIPREVLDKRAVEQGDVKFFELAALAVTVETRGMDVDLNLSDFIIPTDDVPEEVQRAITDWSQWIDYWAVDWNNKGDTFHNEWQSYRTRKRAPSTKERFPWVHGAGQVPGCRQGNRHPWERHDQDGRGGSGVNAVPRRRTPSDQLDLLEARVTTAPCVPAIRKAVEDWRQEKYKGATATSRQLLNYWFHTEHRLRDGSTFAYH